MNKLLKLYNSSGRLGNIILLFLLIISGIFNRMLIAVRYRYPDYIIEIFLIIAAAFIVKRLLSKNFLDIAKRNVVKTLLIAGIVLRLIFAVHDLIDRPVQDSDYEKHEKLGQRIADEGQFYDFAGIEQRNYRQPGLPFIFAIGLKIYHEPVTYAVIMILFSFGVLLSGYSLFKDTGNIGGLLSFAYIAVSPNMLFMASLSNTQMPFFFFVILLFIVLKNYNGKFIQLVFIGLLLAAEMYVRFNFILIIFLVPFIIEKHGQEKLSFIFKKFATVFLFFLLAYSPWIYRNYLVYGTLKIAPSTEGLRWYTANVLTDYTKAGGYNGISDSLVEKYKHLPEIEFDNAFKKETFSFIANNPGFYLKGYPFRLLKYSGRQDWTISYFFDYTEYPYDDITNTFFQSIENLFFWVILFYPFIYLLRNKKLSPLSVYILWAYLFYSMILLPISETRSRYNFPYILFPVFAVAFMDKKEEQDNDENTIVKIL